MFHNFDDFEHPFFNEKSRSQFHKFFKGKRFDRDLAMEGGGHNFFSNKDIKCDKHKSFFKEGNPDFFSAMKQRKINDRNFFKRGDIKIVLLSLLNEQPRHGYELIKVLEEKFKGFYSPSPGSVYPTLQMLEDQGFVEITQEGRKKIYHLTPEGITYLKEHKDEDPIASRMNMFEDVGLEEMQNLRSEIHQVFHEFFIVGRQVIENPEKKEQLQELLKSTQKQLSQIANDNEEKTED